MANSNTSLNGYEFGRSPRTTAPFWGGSGEGAAIDDAGTYTDKTWSSKKISDELAEKADASDLANYAKVTSVYTKSESYSKAEVDNLISDIPAVDAYTKTETDALLSNKANVTDVYTKSQTYTKTEVDNLISGIPAVDAYTKTQTDALLANKANAADVYTKTEADSLLAGKAGVNSVYTKGQTDRLLTDKANAADVYTKTQTDNLLSDKADVTDLADYAKSTAVYTKSQTYTKTEVDNLISGAGGGGSVSYAKTKFSPYNIQGTQQVDGRSEAFTHNNYTWYMEYNNGSRFPVTVTYNDNTSETFMVNGDFFDVPWNETPSGSDYPSETAPYKPFVFGNLVIKMCLTNNVLVDNKYFADVVLMAECDKGVASVSVNLEHAPMAVSMSGHVNTYGTPESVYVNGSAVLYSKQANESYYTKYDVDNLIALHNELDFFLAIDSNYLGELLNATSFGNQVEIAFKLKSGISFTANSMMYIGHLDVSSDWLNLIPLTSMVNGFVYNDSTYFNIDDAGCIMMKPASGSTDARIYLGFKSNYTTTGHEIIRISYMGVKASS